MIKYGTLYLNGAVVRSNIADIKRLYTHNKLSNTKNYKLLIEWTAFFIGLCKVICVLVSFVGICMVLRPVVVYSLTGTSVMMIPVWVPGVDETTKSGYFISTAYHFFVSALAVAGTIGSDTITLLFVLYLWPMSDIFDNMVGVINDFVQIPSLRNSSQLKLFVRNVIQMHQEICTFYSRTSKMYFYQCTIEVNTNGFSLCACVFCILTVSLK